MRTWWKKRSLAERRQRKHKNCAEEDHQVSIAAENLAQQELISPVADGIRQTELPSYLCLFVCLLDVASNISNHWRKYTYRPSCFWLLYTNAWSAALFLEKISRGWKLAKNILMFVMALLSPLVRHLLLFLRYATRRTWKKIGQGDCNKRGEDSGMPSHPKMHLFACKVTPSSQFCSFAKPRDKQIHDSRCGVTASQKTYSHSKDWTITMRSGVLYVVRAEIL
jgi:hypothetical protein